MFMAKRKKRRLKKWVKFAIIILLGVLVAICALFIFKMNSDKKPTNNVVNTTNDNPYDDLYFYDATRQERYVAYHDAHPDYSVSQVVWQVDIDMDKDPYTEMTMIDEAHENDVVLLVNKHFRLRDDYEPENLVTYSGYEMTEETKEAFTKMANDAAKEGIYLNPGSTYRSITTQRNLYNRYVASDGVEEADTYSARAGSSEHHTGRAIDLVGPDWTLGSFGGTAASDWIYENAYKYGFIVRYKEETEYITGYMDEPWHITYVGVSCSTLMHYRNIESLEEYYVRFVMFKN